MPVLNRGRQIQFVNGIQGVAPGGNAVINMDVNKRYHRIKLQCTAINYTGGTAMPTVALTGAGNNDLTVTPTVVNGVITSVAVVSGGTGYTTGDTITIPDATGAGFVGTVTANAGVVTAVAVTNIGIPTPINPATMISSLHQVVNGVIVRDISVENILKIVQAGSQTFPALGELPLLYSEPSFNVNQLNEITSWDMFGQSTFSLRLQISPNVTNPGLVGVMEFDYERNVRPGPNGPIPFLQPVSMHEYTLNLVAGVNNINTIPFDYPIRRLWLQGSNPGNISQLEVYQDGNKAFEATAEQARQMYQDYGFQFGAPNYVNQNIGTNNTLKAAFNPVNYFDIAYISDPDQRLAKALTCENSLVLRVTSEVQQSLTVVAEILPGQYAA